MGNILHQLEAAEDDANLAHLRSEVARLLEAGDRLESQMVAACRERDRLRLTDAERVAILWAIATLETDATAGAGQNAEAAATLCGLLERLPSFPCGKDRTENTP